jgi:hypothetical protein
MRKARFFGFIQAAAIKMAVYKRRYVSGIIVPETKENRFVIPAKVGRPKGSRQAGIYQVHRLWMPDRSPA